MLEPVTIQRWLHDTSCVHVFRTGGEHVIHGRQGDLCHAEDIDLVIQAGLASGKLYRSACGTVQLEGRVDEFCQMVDDLLSYTADEIAVAHMQLEDCGFEVEDLDDMEIAYLDWYAREVWSELAREVDNPFEEQVSLHYHDIIDTEVQRLSGMAV